MPAATPSGDLSLPLDGIEDLIAASATLQSWTGAADAAAAAAYIHWHELIGNVTFPCALVKRIGFGHRRDTPEFLTGEQACGVDVTFYSVPAGIDEKDSFVIHDNHVGAILNEMQTGQRTVGQTRFGDISETETPMREERGLYTDDDSAGDVIRSTYRFSTSTD